MFFAVSILLLYRTTVFRLSVSKHGHLQFLPSHQLRLWPPVGHHPMLGGLFFIVSTIAIKALLLAQGEQLNCLDLVWAQQTENVHILDVRRRQAHGAGVVRVVAVAEALWLVVKVANERLAHFVYVVDEFHAVNWAGWRAVHDSASKRKVAPASPRAMAKRVSEIMRAPG